MSPAKTVLEFMRINVLLASLHYTILEYNKIIVKLIFAVINNAKIVRAICLVLASNVTQTIT